MAASQKVHIPDEPSKRSIFPMNPSQKVNPMNPSQKVHIPMNHCSFESRNARFSLRTGGDAKCVRACELQERRNERPRSICYRVPKASRHPGASRRAEGVPDTGGSPG